LPQARSAELYSRAEALIPAGVSSPVRAFRKVGGTPVFFKSAQGAHAMDEDGNRYLDFCMAWGPLILGHAHPAVVEAVCKAARDGLSFGATCEREIQLAEAVLARFPWAKKVRFVSTGTEAVMSAVRLARGATGRSRIVKFEGCYHGHSDGLLVKGGSGLATLGTPSSAGVPSEYTQLTEVLPLDDDQAARELFTRKGPEIAAVLIEPLPANAGLLVQRHSFLKLLRELTVEHGALLIFDEVISGFRVAPGGMSQMSGIEPDIVTLGKIIGGGMPVGAYLARDAIMQHVAPLGPVYQAGTLSGNPVAMAAGIATLNELAQPGVYERLDATGAVLQRGWERVLERHEISATIARVGSILWLSLQPTPTPRAWPQIDPTAAKRYAPLHRRMLDHGAWLAPSAFEVAFISTAHSDAHIARAIEALDASLIAGH